MDTIIVHSAGDLFARYANTMKTADLSRYDRDATLDGRLLMASEGKIQVCYAPLTTLTTTPASSSSASRPASSRLETPCARPNGSSRPAPTWTPRAVRPRVWQALVARCATI
jgi:hypothetical protein